jgi:hypothetical protein
MEKKKIVLGLFCILAVCSLTFAEGQKKEKKRDYRSVIVDALLVKVSAEALYESGVKPLSEKDKDKVSVLNLLWCLNDPNNGKVIASARTQSLVNEQGKNSFTRTLYIEEKNKAFPANGKGPIVTRKRKPYQQQIEFINNPRILENEQIRIEYHFFSELIEMSDVKTIPDQIMIKFQNVIKVSVQKSFIVGQTQIEDDILFLVVRAEIVN